MLALRLGDERHSGGLRVIERMLTKWIDVWRIETFDSELLAELRAHEKLIHNYMTTDKKNFLGREASDRTTPLAGGFG